MLETEDKVLRDTLERDIFPFVSDVIVNKIRKITALEIKNIEEIRIRAEKPLMIFMKGRDYFVGEDGLNSILTSRASNINRSDVEKTLQLMLNYSIYAYEEELRQGFLTLRGGHRVGLAGRGVIEGNKIKTLKNISGMNIRIAREVKGCGFNIIREIYDSGMKHTLIASPPGCGKTTLLRDIIRILSWGDREISIRGNKVGLVDERSEIAGCYLGIPQRDVGVRTDVLDACPKVQGINMLLRSMSPDIIAVDEIGSMQDAEAIEDAINSGVKVLATAHGRDMDELMKKNGLRKLIEGNMFEKIVILSRKKGPGTIEEIISVK